MKLRVPIPWAEEVFSSSLSLGSVSSAWNLLGRGTGHVSSIRLGYHTVFHTLRSLSLTPLRSTLYLLKKISQSLQLLRLLHIQLQRQKTKQDGQTKKRKKDQSSRALRNTRRPYLPGQGRNSESKAGLRLRAPQHKAP